MSSPEPTETAPRLSKNKTTEKSKKKSKPQPVIVAGSGKNEGDNPHWAYKPPPDSELFDQSLEGETFEWDSIKKDDDLEIWLIRVPDSVNLKNLDGLEIDAPPPSRSGQVGSLSRKGTVYNIWSMGDEDTEFAGAEELRGLSCLLPRRKKSGKLYMAPKEITRHLVVSAQPSNATPLEDTSVLHQNSPRLSHPKESLRHHFVPYGARAQPPIKSDYASMGVDGPADGTHEAQESKLKESKNRKRKIEGEKAHKTAKKPRIAD